MIRAERLSKSFGGRVAVSEVTFDVRPGEVVGFLGPNGAGKTTTMRMLLGLSPPTSGEGHIDGRCGYLPELFNGYDALSVRSYLAFLTRVKRAPLGEVERAMTAARVADLAGRPVGRLSKGQRQRVGLAQSLLGRPPAYVLDEPTQGLDPTQVVDVRRLVRSLADEDGAAVLLSTHLLVDVAAVCDRAGGVVEGRVVAEETELGSVEALEDRFLRLVAGHQLS